MIFKIVRKSMLKKKLLVVSISLLTILMSFFIGINYFTYETLDNNYQNMVSDSNVEEFELYRIEQLEDQYTDQLIEDIETENNIILEEKEIIKYIPENQDQRIYAINKYNDSDEINTLIIEEGSLPTEENDLVLQPAALENLEKEIGDQIEIGKFTFTISGTAYFPDYIMPISPEDSVVYPNFNKFIPVYVNDQTFDQMQIPSDSSYSQRVYYSGVYVDGFTRGNNEKTLDNITEDYIIEIPILDANGKPQINDDGDIIVEELSLFPFSLETEYNIRISGVETEVEGASTLFKTLSLILTIMTISLVVILINSVFKSQRREMGILKAEGVSVGKLSLGFTLFVAVLLIIFMFFGFMLALPASAGMLALYGTIFQISQYPVEVSTMINVVEVLFVVLIIATTLVYLFSIRRNLRQNTLLLIKNIDTEKPPKYNVGQRLKFLSFKTRYKFNILLRNLSKTILLIFGILISSFLILIGTLILTSLLEFQNGTYEDIFNYDYYAKYSTGVMVEQDDNTLMEEELIIQGVISENGETDKLDESDVVNLTGYDFENNQYMHLTNQDTGDELSNTQGIIASSGFMQKYDLEIDDSIIVTNPFDIDEEIELKISGVTDDFYMPQIYMDLDYAQTVFNAGDDYSNAEVGVGNYDYVYEYDEDATVIEAVDLEKLLEDQLSLMISIVLIITILASIIALITLVSITYVIIDSNRKTISVMKVLGYSEKEISQMTIGVYKWIVGIVYILSIPLMEFLIQQVVNVAFADADFVLDVSLNYILSLSGLIVIFLIYYISSKISYRNIKNIKLAESLNIDQ